MFHVHLKRMCILLLLARMLYIYQLSPFDLMCYLRPVFPFWFCFWMICALIWVVVLNSPTIIVSLLICPFMAVNICLIYLVGYIYIYNCCIFLDWSLDHYVVSFFVSCNSLYFKVYFVWCKYCYSSFLFFLIYFIYFYFWLCWVFVAVCGLSLVAVSGGYSSLRHADFSLWWLLLLQSMGSRRTSFSSCGTWAQ